MINKYYKKLNKNIYTILELVSDKYDISFCYEKSNGDCLGGWYDKDKKEIVITDTIKKNWVCFCLFHELGHFYRMKDFSKLQFQKCENPTRYCLEEFIADSFAVLMCEQFSCSLDILPRRQAFFNESQYGQGKYIVHRFNNKFEKYVDNLVDNFLKEFA